MAFTKAHARIAAEMLTDEQRMILKAIHRQDRAKQESETIAQSSIEGLVDLKLGKFDKDIISGKLIFVLTPFGKKVAAEIQ